MKNIPFTNNTGKVVHIGTKTIFPGDTREVNPQHIPNHLRATPAVVERPPDLTEVFNVTEFLAGSVPNIAAQLPALDGPTLDLVQDTEEANPKARKGVLAAIAEERLRRAATDNSDQPTELEQFAMDLRALSDDELAEQLNLYDTAETEAQREIVLAEQERRAAPNADEAAGS